MLDKQKTCRFKAILTFGERSILHCPQTKLDVAHVLARSNRPDLIDSPFNMVMLSRSVHERLDYNLEPFKGVRTIGKNERDYWWFRILTKSTEKFNKSFDYTKAIEHIIEYRQNLFEESEENDGNKTV